MLMADGREAEDLLDAVLDRNQRNRSGVELSGVAAPCDA